MRGLLALALVAGVALACNEGPSGAPTAPLGPSDRPSYPAPGSPPAISREQIRNEIMPLMGQSGLMIGDGANGVVIVGLRSNAEEVARELVARYGTAVEVTVGNFPYPPPEAPQRACASIPDLVANHQPLTATIALQPSVVAGGFFKGKLRFTNAGSAPYELITSSGFTVYLFRASETLPIGSSEGAVGGTGYGKTLAPGGSIELDAGGGTASCDLGVGYVLPAGAYVARALVDYQNPVTFENRRFWSDPVTIDVVDP